MFKSVFLSLLLLFNLNAMAIGGASTLAEVIVKKGLDVLLAGDPKIAKPYAKQIVDSMDMAIKGLTKKKKPSPQELTASLQALKLTDADDVKLRDEIVSLLKKKDPSVADIVATKDKMVLLTSNLKMLDNSAFIACSGSCVAAGSKNLAVVTDPKVLQVAKELPDSPNAQKNYIRQTASSLGIKLPPRWSKALGRDNYRSLATFLKLAEPGSPATPAQVRAMESVKNFSKNSSGEIEFLAEENLHFFFRTIVIGNYKDSELRHLAALLDEAVKRSPSPAGRKQAFFDILEERAQKKPGLRKHFDDLKANNCFFK